MKLSAQIQIRPRSETRERFTNEESLLNILKGLFIKRKATVVEETFAAPDMLNRLSSAFKSCGVSNLVRISHDDTEFYLDSNNTQQDLEKVVDEFREVLHNSFERFYKEIMVIMELQNNLSDYRIELSLKRLHPVGEYPIKIFIYAVSGNQQKQNFEKEFKHFADTLEQNLYKYITINDLKLSFSKEFSNEWSGVQPETQTVPSANENTDIVFFPLYGVILGETTVEELKKLGVKATDKGTDGKPYKYYSINGMNFWHDEHIATHMYLTYTSPIPAQWMNYGLDWNLSYQEFIDLFTRMGFTLSVVKKPAKEWYNGRKTLVAEFHASKRIKNNIQLTIEVYFNYSQKSSISAKGTIYSLRFRTN